jgi:hypothetical protein
VTTTTSSHTLQKSRGLVLVTCLALTAALGSAQIGPVPRQVRPGPAPVTLSVKLQPDNTKVALENTKPDVDFNGVPLGLVGVRGIVVDITKGNPIVSISIADKSAAGKDLSSVYKTVTEKNDSACSHKSPAEENEGGKCTIGLGFMPSDDHSEVDATLTVIFWDGTQATRTLKGTGAKADSCTISLHTFLPLTKGFQPGDVYPVVPKDVTNPLEIGVFDAFGNPNRKSVVNCFYSTNSQFSYFNQFQSIYNAASGATTLNAQLGTLNFANGMQLTVGTNPQVGASNANSAAPGSTSTASAIPTLSATAAAQAAQNVQNGGTIFAFDLFPLIARQVNPLFYLSTVLREGADLQKFNNTSITSTNPSTHTFVGLQSYLQYSSSNNSTNSSDPAGQIFLGGSYGYNLMNHTYSVQNGFGGRVNSQIAQVSAGILFNGGVRIAAYRGFGPSQKYIDSTSMAQKTANNFQTWSIAIAYQSSGKAKQ